MRKFIWLYLKPEALSTNFEFRTITETQGAGLPGLVQPNESSFHAFFPADDCKIQRHKMKKDFYFIQKVEVKINS